MKNPITLPFEKFDEIALKIENERNGAEVLDIYKTWNDAEKIL